ncbi:MAG: NAD(P)H-hydrate epimerase [Gemmatimonadota bacterium]|nr:NAD(P)H-hydrate epimerase [Gemmatimonadota bacterium]
MPDLPFVTTDEMREVDRVMVAEYRIELIQMMENAGYSLSAFIRERFFAGDPRGRRVLAVCGTGSNGGGGLVCARRLHAWGTSVRVLTVHPPDRFMGVPEHQLDIVQRLPIPLTHAGQPTVLGDFDLVVDAMIGYGLDGPPREDTSRLIGLANDLGPNVVSLDVPSGLDATTGETPGEAIRATATLTLALPKTGLAAAGALDYVGELWVADIGVPPELYRATAPGVDVGPVFANAPFRRV